MNTPRHIFLQVDTDSIIAIAEWQNTMHKLIDIECEEVLAHTLIYNQGGMALGNAVEDFGTVVERGDQITFTILPLKLFSNHMLTFQKFDPVANPHVILETEDPKNKVSFIVTVVEVTEDCFIKFNLNILLKHTKGTLLTEIPLCIDPVLRAKQGRGASKKG